MKVRVCYRNSFQFIVKLPTLQENEDLVQSSDTFETGLKRVGARFETMPAGDFFTWYFLGPDWEPL